MASQEERSAGGPLVTVITATYNSSATLALTLQSLLNQDFSDFEAWVVGDHCTDDSEAVVAALGDRRLNWANLPQNSASQSAPNNEGLRRARGRYVAYLGHDDLWFPWHLSALVQHIQQSQADLVHSLCLLVGPGGVQNAIGPPRNGASYDLHFTPPSSWLHSRELTDQIGFWKNPETISWGIDYDYTMRAHYAGKRLEFVPTLGVLKFPSLLWRAYDRTGAPPQLPYWQAIQADPQQLVRRVLLELAIADCRAAAPMQRKPLTIALADLREDFRTAREALIRPLFDLYGRDRWPLTTILRRRFRAQRQNLRRSRGLPPLP